MYTNPSLLKLGDSSRPSAPPSPLVPAASGILPSTGRWPLGLSLTTLNVSRAVKMPEPSGRNARPHGMSLSEAIVETVPGVVPQPPPPPDGLPGTAELLADSLPARSTALTWKAYVLPASRLPTVAVVVSVDAVFLPST